MSTQERLNVLKQEAAYWGRQLSDALAVMSWRRFIILALLSLWISGMISNWPIINVISEIMPVFIVCCILIKFESGARHRAVVGRDAAIVSAEHATAKFEALDARLDAHFLFNAMATVEYLISLDPQKALVLQKSLSLYLRSGLSEPEQSWVASQARACEAYLTIQSIRMGDRLRWHSDWSTKSALMPGRVAIALLEAAVNRGIEPTVDGGFIDLSTQEDNGRWQWIMKCPSTSFKSEDFMQYEHRWLHLAPQAMWNAQDQQGVWTICLTWIPAPSDQSSKASTL